jgi:imidazolonepropionase-like amidohydrolase
MLLADLAEAERHPDVARVPARLRDFWIATAAGAGASPEIAGLRRKQLAKLQELTGVLYRAGVPLLAGTDAPVNFCPPGFALHQELELLVASGLPPAAALSAATCNNARALDAWSQLGSVEPGKLADLVVLDADPLADIRNTRRISRVIRGGIVCDPAALLQLVPEK